MSVSNAHKTLVKLQKRHLSFFNLNRHLSGFKTDTCRFSNRTRHLSKIKQTLVNSAAFVVSLAPRGRGGHARRRSLAKDSLAPRHVTRREAHAVRARRRFDLPGLVGRKNGAEGKVLTQRQRRSAGAARGSSRVTRGRTPAQCIHANHSRLNARGGGRAAPVSRPAPEEAGRRSGQGDRV